MADSSTISYEILNDNELEVPPLFLCVESLPSWTGALLGITEDIVADSPTISCEIFTKYLLQYLSNFLSLSLVPLFEVQRIRLFVNLNIWTRKIGQDLCLGSKEEDCCLC